MKERSVAFKTYHWLLNRWATEDSHKFFESKEILASLKLTSEKSGAVSGALNRLAKLGGIRVKASPDFARRYLFQIRSVSVIRKSIENTHAPTAGGKTGRPSKKVNRLVSSSDLNTVEVIPTTEPRPVRIILPEPVHRPLMDRVKTLESQVNSLKRAVDHLSQIIGA